METQTGLSNPEISSQKPKKPLNMRQVAFVDALAAGQHNYEGRTDSGSCGGVRHTDGWNLAKPHLFFLCEQTESLKQTLGERMLKLTALSLDHLEHTLSQPAGTWHDRKNESAQIVLSTMMKLLAKEGRRYDTEQTTTD
jgi:hypothetical protein